MRHFLYRLKYRYARSLSLSKPVDVSLELAADCNQSCGYCYYGDRKHLPFKTGFMTWDLAEKVIRDAANIGVHSIKFNYRGESTLSPIFSASTMLAKKLAHGSTFIDRITNSNFKFDTHRDYIFEGLSNQTKVKVSFDSFDPKVMSKQRAGSNHALALENIEKFYNWPGRKTQLVIQAVRTKLNLHEDIESEVRRRWPDATCNINDMTGGRNNKDLSGLQVKARSNERESCLQAHARLIVRWDGGVQACCPSIKDEITLGNMNDNTIKQIWNGLPAIWLRRELKSGLAFKKNPCKLCSSFESYQGFKPKWES